MPSTQAATDQRFSEYASAQPTAFSDPDPLRRKPRRGAGEGESLPTVETLPAAQCEQGLAACAGHELDLPIQLRTPSNECD